MTGTRARRREPFSWWYRFAAMDRLGTGLFASVSEGEALNGDPPR